MNNYLITIIGPTAIGKTALSIQLAQHFKCNIISCDSRQFYKETTIGTAVPNTQELQVAKHYFIQHKSIFESYNVGDFEREALATLNTLFLENPIQIMVGGSGLYADALLYGLDNFPEVGSKIREELQKEYTANGIKFLHEQLLQLDPDYVAFLEKNNPQTLKNPQRMLRFVEVCLASNLPYSTYLNQPKKIRNFIPILIGLEANRDLLYNRINQRVDAMFENGLELEAKEVYPNKHLNALQTVGYKELFDFFDGNSSFEFAKEAIKKNTRRFAKRQLTWFKRNKNSQWFDYQKDINTIIDYVDSKLI